MELKTVLLSVADMGFEEGALTREIIGQKSDVDMFGIPSPYTGGRLQQLGLKLCPAETGPQLRLQYTDQPKGECLYIAMQPIPASDRKPRIFVVCHNDKGLALDAKSARPTDRWAPDAKFVACQD